MASPKSSKEFSRLTDNSEQINKPSGAKRKTLQKIIPTEESRGAPVIDNTRNIVVTGREILKENEIEVFGFNSDTNSGKAINAKKLTEEEIRFFETPSNNKQEKNEIFNKFIEQLEEDFKEKKIPLLELVVKREAIRADREGREKIDYSMCYERGVKLVTGHSFHMTVARDTSDFINVCTKYINNKGLEGPITEEEYFKTIDISTFSVLKNAILTSNDAKKDAGYASILYEFMWRNEPALQLSHWPQDRSGYSASSLFLGGFLGDAARKVNESLREFTGQTLIDSSEG